MELLLGRTEIGVDRKERDLVAGAALARRVDEEVEQREIVLPARRAMRKPPPPGEANTASATKLMKVAASAASKALPPSSRISAAACAVNACPAATTLFGLLISLRRLYDPLPGIYLVELRMNGVERLNGRYVIGRPGGARSNLWRVFSRKSDVYLITSGPGEKIEKLSFHEFGICRKAFTREYGTPPGLADLRDGQVATGART